MPRSDARAPDPARAELVLRGRRVVTPDGERPASVFVRDGVIVAVGDPDAAATGATLVDAGDRVVSPGLVDTHVHCNEPGRTDWEGFANATRAAAAGGVTTVLDMPLNSVPPTTSVPALEAKRAAAAGQAWVDVGFWGGAVPDNVADLTALHAAGVFGFKCFLVPSGVDEFGFLDGRQLRATMTEVQALGAQLAVHAELPGPLERAAATGDPRRYATYLASRPGTAEDDAVALLAGLARELGCRVHVVHVSSADALDALARARADGVAISAETCPHYLALSAEEVPDGATEFKCAPPIRSAGNRERLWDALAGGLLDAVVSDHSPAPPSLKCRDTGDLLAAWGGVSSLQLGLPVVWTEARRRGHPPAAVAAWMSAGPARVVGLARKGSIAVGHDADLVVWDPDATFTVDPVVLEHRHPLTPYAGRRLHGVVHATFVRGRAVYGEGRVTGTASGTLLQRGDA